MYTSAVKADAQDPRARQDDGPGSFPGDYKILLKGLGFRVRG